MAITSHGRVGWREGWTVPASSLARDAVHAELAIDGLAEAIGRPVIEVRSRARDRIEYLRRPDLGRKLDPEDAAKLSPTNDTLAIVIADGLSAIGVHAHAASTVNALVERLPEFQITSVIVARQSRVAIGNEIGAFLSMNNPRSLV